MAISYERPQALALKGVLEVSIRHLMEQAGKGHLFQGIAGPLQQALGGPMTKGLFGLLSMAGGTLGALSPLRGLLAPVLGRVFGMDPDAATDIAIAVASAVGEGLPEGMSEGLDETKIKKQTEEKFKQMTGPGGSHHAQFARLTADPSKEARKTEVYVRKVAIAAPATGTATATPATAAAFKFEIHHLDCPDCQPEKRKGKKGTTIEVPKAIKSTLGYAIDECYGATEQLCCTVTINKLIKIARRKLMKFQDVVWLLPPDSLARQLYDSLFAAPGLFTPEQQREFDRIRHLDAWTADEAPSVESLLIASFNELPGGTYRFHPTGSSASFTGRCGPSRPYGIP